MNGDSPFHGNRDVLFRERLKTSRPRRRNRGTRAPPRAPREAAVELAFTGRAYQGGKRVLLPLSMPRIAHAVGTEVKNFVILARRPPRRDRRGRARSRTRRCRRAICR